MERIHDRGRVGQILGGGGLEAGEPDHRDDLKVLAPALRPVGEPGFELLLGAARDHVQQEAGPGAVTDRGQVNDHSHVLVAAADVAPHVLIDSDHRDAVEALDIVDQDPPTLGATEALAVFHETANAHAIQAMVKCPTTSPSSAQRRSR